MSRETELPPNHRVLKSEPVKHFSNTLLQEKGALAGAVASADLLRAPLRVERLCQAQLPKPAWVGTPASLHRQMCVHVLRNTPGAGICTGPDLPRASLSQTPILPGACTSARELRTAYPGSTLSASQQDPTKHKGTLFKLMNIISKPTSMGRRES